MTVASTTRKTTYTGNGSTKTFAIPFHFQKAADIQASYVLGGNTTILSGFTVSGTGIGATVTFTTAIPSGATLTIERTLDMKQETNFRTQGAFPPGAIEDALDKLMMVHHQREDTLTALAAADATLAASVSAEAVARIAADLAVSASVLATLATELATIRAEFTTQPGSVIDARTILATLGITARSSADHMSDKRNIKDFGATTGGSGASNDAAITAALAVDDFVYVPKGNFTIATYPDVSRLYGPGQLVLGGVTIPLGQFPVPTVPENQYPNSQWQVGSGHGKGTKMNHEGTGTQGPLTVSAYEVGSNTPLCTCAAIGQLKVGDLLAFAAPSDECFRVALVEVTEIGGGGFRVQLPLGLKTVTSVACTALPTMNGGHEALGSGDAFDWWKRTPFVQLTGTMTFTNGSATVTGVGTSFTTELAVGVKIRSPASGYFEVLTVDSNTQVTLTGNFTGSTSIGAAGYRTGTMTWREDFAVNTKKGSKYSCGILKALGPAEHVYHEVQPRDLHRFQGKRVVIGFGVMHKVRNVGGAGTWRPFVNTDGTGGGVKYGPASTAAVGAWDWREFSFVVPEDATYIHSGVELLGAKADTYYLSHPMMAFGRYLGPWNYSQPKGECISPIVHIQFMTFLNTSPKNPSALSAATGKGNDTDLRGSDNSAFKSFVVNPHAETNGAIAPTVRAITVKAEGRCETIGDALGFSNNNAAGAAHTFGPLMYSQSAGYMMPPEKATIPLDYRGWCYTIAGLVALTGTVTFTNGSATVTGVGTRFLNELSNGILIKHNTNSGNKMYRVKARASDTSLTLGVPGGADATFDEATAAGVGALKIDANMYNWAVEINDGIYLN